MSEMVERACAAALAVSAPTLPWSELHEEWRAAHRRDMRAAFAVLREPSDAMVEKVARALTLASWGADYPWESFGPEAQESTRSMARAAIVAAIDAALEGKS